MVDSILSDVRLALRTLAKSPGFLFVAVTSLALGIGANSTIFSLVRATVFPSLPYREPARLVDLHETSGDVCAGCGVGTSFATFLEWRERATRFSGMGASREQEFVVAGQDDAVRVSGAIVSADLFPTLGIAPVLGRGFTAEEDRLGAAPVALLSHGLWERLFGADTGLVGRTIRVNGTATTVIGVMPRRFGYPEFAKLWMPMTPAITTASRSDRSIDVVARLAPGATLAQARSEMAALGAGIAAEHPADFRGWTADATSIVAELRAESGPPFAILLGASAFVLLIACANLANLMLVRASRREREVAVRVALGAGRRRLVRMLLAECFLVALAGGSLGLLIALWGVDAVPHLIGTEIPFWIVFQVDWSVVAFAIALATVTALAFGLVPALRASRPDLVASLKEGAGSSTGSVQRGRLRSLLVAAQIACALVLLAGAGLMIRTFMRARAIDDLGYDPRNVLVANVSMWQPRYDDPSQVTTFGGAVEERVRAVPGVTAVSLEHNEFLSAFVGAAANLTLEGAAEAVSVNTAPGFARAVGVDYFSVLRIPIRRGRAFTPADRPGAPAVAIVNEAAAQALWPNADPIGKRFKLGQPNDERPWLTVVGVVGSTIASPLRHQPTKFIYVPFAQHPGRPLSVIARTTGSPMVLAPLVRAEIRASDPDVATDAITSMEASLATYISPVRFFVRLLGALSVLAVGLAALGIYGVVSYAVAQRTREIGIRMALGATSDGIRRLVIGYGVGLAALGIVVGLAGSAALTGALAGVLRGLLFDASTTDPVVLGGVALLLAAIAVAACYVPARRATQVEPLVALRNE